MNRLEIATRILQSIIESGWNVPPEAISGTKMNIAEQALALSFNMAQKLKEFDDKTPDNSVDDIWRQQ